MNLTELLQRKKEIEEEIIDLQYNLLKTNEEIINFRGPFLIKDKVKGKLMLTDGISYSREVDPSSFKIDVLTKIIENLMNGESKIEPRTHIYSYSTYESSDHICLSYNSDTNDFELICDLDYNTKKFNFSRNVLSKLIIEIIQCSRYV